MIYFAGKSHAAIHLREAARKRGLEIMDEPWRARLIFISEDTPTLHNGLRNLQPIKTLIDEMKRYDMPLVLTSQVPPGFTRSLGLTAIWHQAETLRILDAEERAFNPEQIIVGGDYAFNAYYLSYLLAFQCPILRMSWEDAEFAKIAINMFLASQVDTTNRLSQAAAKVGAKWENVAKVLSHDKRIGPHSYLKPGRWQDSTHLLRDAVTLDEIECTAKTI